MVTHFVDKTSFQLTKEMHATTLSSVPEFPAYQLHSHINYAFTWGEQLETWSISGVLQIIYYTHLRNTFSIVQAHGDRTGSLEIIPTPPQPLAEHVLAITFLSVWPFPPSIPVLANELNLNDPTNV
jgi:hypothetical protein